VVVSTEPKEEVARGLVPARQAGREPVEEAGSVAGERVRVERGGTSAEFEPGSRVPLHHHAEVEQIRWAEGPMEIEKFHAALVNASAALAPLGGAWTDARRRLEQALATLPPQAIQNATRVRLERWKRAHGVLPGNLFAVEAAAVLEHLMYVLFDR
jgi:hypothetical protein